MKLTIFIDKEKEEAIHVYAHERTPLVEEISRLVERQSSSLIGYDGRDGVPIVLHDVFCFMVEDNRVYAVVKDKKYQLKQRLYQLEQMVSSDFVKINQSCIINMQKIQKFSASFSGTLTVTLKNGYVDYVSRRNVKQVKERLGV